MKAKDRVAENCSVTGETDPYVMTRAMSAAHQRFRDAFADLTTGLGYVAQTIQGSPNGAKIEIGEMSTLTYDAVEQEDTLSRGRILFSSAGNNDPVDWVASDVIVIFQAPLFSKLNLLQPDWEASPGSFTIGIEHFGKVLDINVASGNAAVAMTSGTTLGHGFKCWVYGYGSTSNSIVLTPPSGQKFNELSIGATKSILGGVKSLIEWNDTRACWIVSP